jgi:hypothetical protein
VSALQFMLWKEGVVMKSRYSRRLLVLPVACFLALAIPNLAAGQCTTLCSVEAQPSSDPKMGDWEYTLTIEWDTGSGLNMDHIDILLDTLPMLRACSCPQLQDGFKATPGDTVGLSESTPGKSFVYYTAEHLCFGEMGLEYVILKFYPFGGQNNETGSAGIGTFTIYSDFAPVSVDSPNLLILDEQENQCSGQVQGDLPGLPCDPVPAEKTSWGIIKSVYK